METRRLDFYVGDLYRPETIYAIKVAGESVSHRLADIPVDQGLILGFGTTVSTLIGEVFVAYTAPKRESASTAPDYQAGLSLIVNDRLYRLADEGITISHTTSLNHRVFYISAHGKNIVTVKYCWPFYREALTRLIGDPFGFKSADIFFEIVEMAHVYTKRALG